MIDPTGSDPSTRRHPPPRELIVTFSMDTWADAVQRDMVRPPDRLLETLLETPGLNLMVVNPPRSALAIAVKRLLGRGQPPLGGPVGGSAALVQPAGWRRDSPTTRGGAERVFARYDRCLRRAARKAGMTRPPVVTFNPLVAAFCALRWAGPVVYYARDDWTVHPSFEPWWPLYEQAYQMLRRRGVTVAAVSQELLARVGVQDTGVVVPNGIDATEWDLSSRVPGTGGWSARPLMVYAGTLDDRLDPQALLAVCDRFPQGSLVLIGPLLAEEGLREVLGRPNVHTIHPDERMEVVRLIEEADVCLLPHRRTPLTEAMNPLKIYEYLAAGRPVAASDLSGARGVHPKVRLTAPGPGFAQAVEEALEDGPMDDASREAFVAANSWEQRHQQLFALIERLTTERAAPRTSTGQEGSRMPMDPPYASVIIPAHDEEDTIANTLRVLTEDAAPGDLEIVVVCNGCSDDTAAVAAGVPGVEVVEIDESSKLAALRAGDRTATVFPRVYLDADMELPTHTVLALAAAMEEQDALAGAIPGRLDLSDAGLLVTLFYEFRERLPVYADGGVGAGVYAMSAKGRARFGEWPDLRSGDDQFVFRLFSSEERVSLRGHETVVQPPADLRAVLRRAVRTRRGNARLTAGAAGRELPPPAPGRRTALLDAARTPRGIASAVVFVSVAAIARLRARFGRGGGDWAAR